MVRIAALTMTWKEAYSLPLWLRHYTAQLRAETCYLRQGHQKRAFGGV